MKSSTDKGRRAAYLKGQRQAEVREDDNLLTSLSQLTEEGTEAREELHERRVLTSSAERQPQSRFT